MVDRFEEIVNVVENYFRDCFKMFDRLKGDAEKYLYSGCGKFIRLLIILKFYNLKASNGCSDKSFMELFLFPNDNVFFS